MYYMIIRCEEKSVMYFIKSIRAFLCLSSQTNNILNFNLSLQISLNSSICYDWCTNISQPRAGVNWY